MLEKKEEILTHFYDLSPYTIRKSKRQETTQKRHFDYTTIAYRLRSVRFG